MRETQGPKRDQTEHIFGSVFLLRKHRSLKKPNANSNEWPGFLVSYRVFVPPGALRCLSPVGSVAGVASQTPEIKTRRRGRGGKRRPVDLKCPRAQLNKQHNPTRQQQVPSREGLFLIEVCPARMTNSHTHAGPGSVLCFSPPSGGTEGRRGEGGGWDCSEQHW